MEQFHVLHIVSVISHHVQDAAHGVGLIRTGEPDHHPGASGPDFNVFGQFGKQLGIPVKEHAILVHPAGLHDFPHHRQIFRQPVFRDSLGQFFQDGLFPVRPVNIGFPGFLLGFRHHFGAVQPFHEKRTDLGVDGIDFFTNLIKFHNNSSFPTLLLDFFPL